MNTIAIYSDLICPWCRIGKRRMEEALRHADTVDRPRRRAQLRQNVEVAGPF